MPDFLSGNPEFVTFDFQNMRYIIFISWVMLFIGCQDDHHSPDILELSMDSISLNNEEHIVKVAVKSNQEWQVTGATNWCKPDKSNGMGEDSLTIQLDVNLLTQNRNATLVIKTPDLHRTLRITQWGSGAGYHYKLPLVFHILYNDPTDPEQNVSAEWIYGIIKQSNLIYSNSEHSIDINLEFIPVTHDPEGNPLPEPGIHRIQWPSSITMDCNVFMKNKNILPYVWDLNNYINIFVYSFNNRDVLGISYLPYTLSSNPLEGLKYGDYHLTYPTLDYPHCISINNKFILTEHFLKIPDFVLTLTHELGHYLGLFHVFIDGKNLTDYCDDTQTYDRKAYENWLMSLTESQPFARLARRTTPEGIEFTSYNIMDYDFSYLNQFTPDQKKRIRHVLENSPLIPGPKNKISRSRSNPNLEKPEARTIKWERKR